MLSVYFVISTVIMDYCTGTSIVHSILVYTKTLFKGKNNEEWKICSYGIEQKKL